MMEQHWQFPRVGLICGAPSVCRPYRSGHIVKVMEQCGGNVRFVDEDNFNSWDRISAQAESLVSDRQLLIFHRVPYSCEFQAVIDVARAAKVVTVWESDDLIFVPGADKWVAAVGRLDFAQRELYKEGVHRYNKAFLACDIFLGSTGFLAQIARRLGKRSYVLENTIATDFRERASSIGSNPCQQAHRDSVVIGYGAGTSTHDSDFLQARGALRRIMGRHQQVVLRVVGEVDLGDYFSGLEDQIEHHNAVQWCDWPEVLSGFDINLAPLEPRNPYCRAKSALKYIEAGYLGIPTVASDTDVFRQAITAGKTGFVARDSGEWEAQLEELVVDSNTRSQLGQAAKEDVRWRHSVQKGRRALQSVLSRIADRESSDSYEKYAKSEIETSPLTRIAWLILEPFAGSGGHNDIFQIGAQLEKNGHSNSLHIRTNKSASVNRLPKLRRYVAEHFAEMEGEFHLGWDGIDQADIVVPTFWSSAYAVRQQEQAATVYFVQDFEPFFFRRGDDKYVKAENTYRLGFSALTLGFWLANALRADYGTDVVHWDFPVDRRYYGVKESDRSTGARLACFAQPGKPRRAYDLGIRALEQFAIIRPDVEIVLFGSDKIDASSLSFESTILGILSDEELADLYRSSTAGMVLSYTNPSLVPFAMLASGCPVVDIDVAPNRSTYGEESGVLLCEPTPHGISGGLQLVFDDTELRRDLTQQGLRFTQNLSFEHSAKQVEAAFVRAYLTGTVGDQPRVLILFQGRGQETTKALRGDYKVRQTVRVSLPVLDRVDVRIADFGKPLKGSLRLRVLDSTGNLLAEKSREVAGLSNWGWCGFEFSGVDNEPGNRIVLEITGKERDSAGSTGLVFNRGDRLSGESLTLDEKSVDGTLALRIFGREQKNMTAAKTPDLGMRRVRESYRKSRSQQEGLELSRLAAALEAQGKQLSALQLAYEREARVTNILRRLPGYPWARWIYKYVKNKK